MAPRFKQLLFQVYAGSHGANAFVGFPVYLFEQICPFRDALRDEFVRITGFKYRIGFGGYKKDIDVDYHFYEIKDADTVNSFFSKPWPGCFGWLFRTRYYREYKAEEMKVKDLIKILLTTSHDYPCVTVDSSILTVSMIAECIVKVALDLELEILESKFLYQSDSILTSNNTYDISNPGV